MRNWLKCLNLKNKTGDKGQISDKAGGGMDKPILLVRGVKLNARQRKVTVARTS